MRTLIRAGRRGALVRIEGDRQGTRFFLRGPERAEREVFFDLEAATLSFEAVERGVVLRPCRRSIVERFRNAFPEFSPGSIVPYGRRTGAPVRLS